ncbi:unnamed protein product [Adineta ricciae]|uniref:MORN repeat protein n=1 Tax=Adineta ricciae TaxID=249248 RepID=A0A815TB63_ADIRI|nr:unnamed protein product [Adineta ricciae]
MIMQINKYLIICCVVIVVVHRTECKPSRKFIEDIDDDNRKLTTSDKGVKQKSNFKRIDYDNGDHYEGEIKDGKRSGKGTLIYADGRKYVGQFKNDKFHGDGKFIWKNGDMYDGDFKNVRRIWFIQICKW